MKDFRIRQCTCPSCGVNHDRDINAAVNLRGCKTLQRA
ncbi:MAG: transposase [Synergistaceae bacterium]|nr:transposase [Synergistaceae bacterium]